MLSLDQGHPTAEKVQAAAASFSCRGEGRSSYSCSLPASHTGVPFVISRQELCHAAPSAQLLGTRRQVQGVLLSSCFHVLSPSFPPLPTQLSSKGRLLALPAFPCSSLLLTWAARTDLKARGTGSLSWGKLPFCLLAPPASLCPPSYLAEWQG